MWNIFRAGEGAKTTLRSELRSRDDNQTATLSPDELTNKLTASVRAYIEERAETGQQVLFYALIVPLKLPEGLSHNRGHALAYAARDYLAQKVGDDKLKGVVGRNMFDSENKEATDDQFGFVYPDAFVVVNHAGGGINAFLLVTSPYLRPSDPERWKERIHKTLLDVTRNMMVAGLGKVDIDAEAVADPEKLNKVWDKWNDASMPYPVNLFIAPGKEREDRPYLTFWLSGKLPATVGPSGTPGSPV